MALAACASTLLLALTNHVTQNVAPVPLLWVVLLGVYLLGFVLCFERQKPDWKLDSDMAMFASALFVCCMFCHSELARLKPHSPCI
jgi:hypothetical protein